MFKIENRTKRILQTFMFFGFLAVIISFYQSHKDHYTSKEIDKEIYSISKEEVKSYLKKNSKDSVTDNQVDSMMSSNRLPEKITDRIYQRISKDLGCDLKRDHHLSSMGDVLNVTFTDSGRSKTISGEIDHAGFVKLPIDKAGIDLPLKYIYAKGLSLEEIKKKVMNKLKKQMNDEILKTNLINDKLDRENAIVLIEEKYDNLDLSVTLTYENTIYKIKEKAHFYLYAKSNRPWTALLFNTYFFLGISLFAVFFIALQYVSEAAWSIVLKRVPEAVMKFLPIASIFMLLIMIASIMHFGGNHLYHWMAEGIMDDKSKYYDKIIAGKEAYLNATFFIARSIIYIIGWIYFARKLSNLSLSEDKHGGLSYYKKGIRTSAWFIVFFAVTSSMAAWDWIMSIDAHWFSTLFGWYVFAEWAAVGFTTILLFTLYLKRKGHLQTVNDSHIHDLGKWIFAFSLVWTYMWFSQFMLIWYSNIPEEVAYFTARWEIPQYRFLFWFSMIINFLSPLIILMSRDAKRHNGRLILVSIIILFGHWLNSYLLVAPGTLNVYGQIGFTEIGIGIGFVGLFLYVVMKSLSKVPLDVKNHPFLDESKHLHT